MAGARLAAMFAAASVATSLAAAAAAGPAPLDRVDSATSASLAPGDEALLLQPRLNGGRLDEPIFVLRRKGEIWLPRAWLDAHNISMPEESPDPEALAAENDASGIGARTFVRTRDITSLVVQLDLREGRIELQCGAACFRGGSLSAHTSAAPRLSLVEPGGFLNYDAFLEAGDGRRSAGGLAEIGVFSDFGSGLTSLFCSVSADDKTCGRLETSWTIDDPATARRLVIGDSTTRAAVWGSPARFGGLSWGTDFSLQPTFITFPTPVLAGESTLPSSVEVYINDALRFQGSPPTGAFTVTDIPVVTGDAKVRTVVRDLLGREQSVETQFYISPELVKPGLNIWALEGGFLREDFGDRSNAYSQPFIAVGLDRGLTEALTLGLRSEIGESQRTLGLSAVVGGGRLGVTEGSLALSDDDGDGGMLGRVSQEYNSRWLSLGGAISYATSGFRPFGSTRQSPRLLSNAFLGFNTGDHASASLSWTYRDDWDQPDFSALGVQYASRLFGASVLLSGLRTLEPDAVFTASLTVSVPLGRGASASASIDHARIDQDRRGLGVDVRARKDPGAAGGIGYHLQAAANGVERVEAGVVARSTFGDIAADISHIDGSNVARLSARGGAAMLDGELIASSSIGGAVAVVSVGQEPGVHVFHDRQPVGVTDARGRVVVTGLRPFQQNTISFEANDLDLAADFESTDLVITPGFRTGHVAAFDVARPLHLIVRLRTEAGDALPAGASVENEDTGEAYPVGSSGLVYVENAEAVTRLRYARDGFTCRAAVRAPDEPSPGGEPEGPTRDAGEVVCRTSPQLLALRPRQGWPDSLRRPDSVRDPEHFRDVDLPDDVLEGGPR